MGRRAGVSCPAGAVPYRPFVRLFFIIGREMTVVDTVAEVPEDRRVTLRLPDEFPCGSLRLVIVADWPPVEVPRRVAQPGDGR